MARRPLLTRFEYADRAVACVLGVLEKLVRYASAVCAASHALQRNELVQAHDLAILKRGCSPSQPVPAFSR